MTHSCTRVNRWCSAQYSTSTPSQFTRAGWWWATARFTLCFPSFLSCLMRMSMSKQVWHLRMSHGTWMRRVTLVNALCHTCECVVPQTCLMRMSMLRLVPHVGMGHVTLRHETCHTCEWVMSHLRMSHATHVKVPCHTQSRRKYRWMTSRDVMCDTMTQCGEWHDDHAMWRVTSW